MGVIQCASSKDLSFFVISVVVMLLLNIMAIPPPLLPTL